jgi:predicted MFS family arabinose efflux permease
MVAADLVRALLLLTIPAAALLGILSLAQLYVVAFAAGSLSVLFSVAYNVVFVRLVARDEYIDAGSLLNGSRAVSIVGGNGIAGLLVHWFSAPFALFLDACSYLASAFFVGRAEVEEAPDAEPSREEGNIAGIGFIARTPLIRACVLAAATLNLFNFGFYALLVLYATDSLGVGAGGIGLAFAIGGVGCMVGAALAGPVSRRFGLGPSLIFGFVLIPAPLLLVPLAGGMTQLSLGLLIVAEFFNGIGVMLLDVGLGALWAAAVPDRLRARVSGAFLLVNYGVRPLGALAGGLLATLIGLQTTMWVTAIGALAGVLWLLPSPIPRLRELPKTALEG